MAEAAADAIRVVVARVGEVAPGTTKKFAFVAGGQEIEAFLVNYAGELHGYINRCRHVPMSLDWIDNQFFTEEGDYLLCATHGACYAPDTGECVSGPPLGKFLVRVRLTIENDEVIATLPDCEIPPPLTPQR